MSDPINSYSLYPRRDSLAEVQQELEAQLPITNPNDLHRALMLYHNTLLYALQIDYGFTFPWETLSVQGWHRSAQVQGTVTGRIPRPDHEEVPRD